MPVKILTPEARYALRDVIKDLIVEVSVDCDETAALDKIIDAIIDEFPSALETLKRDKVLTNLPDPNVDRKGHIASYRWLLTKGKE